MARPKSIVPAYREHNATAQAVVTLPTPSGTRRDVYLGRFGTDASVIEYARALIDWKSGNNTRSPEPGGLSIAELVLAFFKHAATHYGENSKELSAFKYAIKPLRQLYGPTPAAAFGPKALKAVRDRMIEMDWCRQIVNRQVNRVRRVFRWATSEELVPAAVLHALESLPGLPRGRSAAREAPPVQPVADADVDGVLPYLVPTLHALVQFQRLTGCRPGEAIQLRMTDVERTGDVWLYRPRQHKLQWRGRERIIAVGPRAQKFILELLSTDQLFDAPVFSPRRAMEERSALKRANRKSKVQPSQLNRRTSKPRKAAGETYTTQSYARAIKYAIDQANRSRAKSAISEGIELGPTLINHWHPNQLRHSRATELRRKFGIETAQVTLGHAELRTTEIYAEKNLDLAIKIASQTG